MPRYQHFYLPVKDYRNGFRAIANGTQSPGSMELVNVTRTSDVRVGDLFVTSGFALQFPVGYPVAKVVAIKRQPGRKFLQIDLEPMAHLQKSQLLLLAWPQQAALREAVLAQIKAPLPVASG